MTDTWITKSSRQSLKAAIRARLKIGDAHANRIIENAWLVLPNTPLRGCLVTVTEGNPMIGAKPSLTIYVPTAETLAGTETAKYEYAGGFEIDEDDLIRWRLLDLLEAYALPKGFSLGGGTWIDATVLDATIADDDTIDVSVRLDDDRIVTYTKKAVINTLEGTLDYVREYIGCDVQLLLETEDGRTTICLMRGERTRYDLAA